MPVSGPGDNLRGYHLVVVKRDDIAVSTKEAYAAITPQAPAKCCRDIVRQPIETWKEELVNDFEQDLSSRCTRNWQKSNRSCTTWVPYMQR